MTQSNIYSTCEEKKPRTPIRIYNPPGLNILAYRVGTHSSFKESMISYLPEYPVLSKLTTRENDDFVINLFDAWATVGDVLTFYQERIANEGFLRTAIERKSVLELSRFIGRELGTGVAADAFLTFEVEDAPGVIEKSIIPVGTRVQSLPAQDETPQIFETVEKIEARPEWNKIKPKQHMAQDVILPDDNSSTLIIKMNDVNLKKNDLLFIIKGQTHRIVKIIDVKPNFEKNTITVTIKGHEHEEDARIQVQDSLNTEVYWFKVKCGIFGNNAPNSDSLPGSFKSQFTTQPNWDTVVLNGVRIDEYSYGTERPSNTIFLENSYPEISLNSLVIFESPSACRAFSINTVADVTVADFLMSKKVTGITLYNINSHKDELHSFGFRDTSVYIQSEQLTLANVVCDYSIQEDIITLDAPVEGLSVGQHIAISGEKKDGEIYSEIVQIEEIHELNNDNPTLRIDRKVKKDYLVDKVNINANVAKATHGEIKFEVLGSGDPTQHQQEFTLRQKPLTYVNAAVEGGKSSTLEIIVDDIKWNEVPSLYNKGPNERCYIVRNSNEGVSHIFFGDGRRGARLPVGRENIIANYRVGLGLKGLLKPGQLKILMSQPYGVRSVTNPLATTNVGDPETLTEAREKAPIHLMAMDRIVSIIDVENYVKKLDWVGKAKAYKDVTSGKKVVKLVFAPASGKFDPNPEVISTLKSQLDAVKDPLLAINVEQFIERKFDVTTTITISKDREFDKVKATVVERVLDAFSFTNMQIGKEVSEEEIIAVIQGIDGVEKVTLTFEIIPFIITNQDTENEDNDDQSYRRIWVVNNVTVMEE